MNDDGVCSSQCIPTGKAWRPITPPSASDCSVSCTSDSSASEANLSCSGLSYNRHLRELRFVRYVRKVRR